MGRIRSSRASSSTRKYERPPRAHGDGHCAVWKPGEAPQVKFCWHVATCHQVKKADCSGTRHSSDSETHTALLSCLACALCACGVDVFTVITACSHAPLRLGLIAFDVGEAPSGAGGVWPRALRVPLCPKTLVTLRKRVSEVSPARVLYES